MIAIRGIRKKNNMTQADLATMIQKTPAAVSRYETGLRSLDLNTAVQAIVKSLPHVTLNGCFARALYR